MLSAPSNKPIAPRRCPHNEGEDPEPFYVDKRLAGYHYRCRRCQMILRTDELPR